MAKFIENVDFFMCLLQEAPTQITLSHGKAPSFGRVRHAVMNLIVGLVLAESELCSVLVQCGFYGLAFEMLFEYPTNNILHDQVLQLFLVLCTRYLSVFVDFLGEDG
jgi:hypothetical protein